MRAAPRGYPGSLIFAGAQWQVTVQHCLAIRHSDEQVAQYRAFLRCLADARCVICEELPIPDLKLRDLLVPGNHKVLHADSAAGASDLHTSTYVTSEFQSPLLLAACNPVDLLLIVYAHISS